MRTSTGLKQRFTLTLKYILVQLSLPIGASWVLYIVIPAYASATLTLCFKQNPPRASDQTALERRGSPHALRCSQIFRERHHHRHVRRVQLSLRPHLEK